MVPRAPPDVTPPSVLRPDWKTIARLSSTRSKPLDLDVCPHRLHPRVDVVAQLTNRTPLDFEA
jgi:hypothetical protein